MDLAKMAAWAVANPDRTAAISVGVFNTVVAIALRLRTAAEWMAFAAERPVLAMVLRVLRAAFPDPVRTIAAVAEAMPPKAPPGPRAPLPAMTNETDATAPPTTMRRLVAVGLLGVTLGGCAWLGLKPPSEVTVKFAADAGDAGGDAHP